MAPPRRNGSVVVDVSGGRYLDRREGLAYIARA
jgi:hypothetical protein